ncbi:MAG: riboflavin biosynthesis protein RibF [Tepidisphaeraceae bacterium]
MLRSEGILALRYLPPGAIMSIGNFDGVHRGHRSIIETARHLKSPGQEQVVVTFEPHTLTVLRPEMAPPRICSPARKREILAAMRVDRLITLAPTPDVLNLSAESFFAILKNEARVAHLVEGKNFFFGKGRAGNVDRLREWCKQSNIGLTVAPQIDAELDDRTIVPVSSSTIRWLVAHGRVRDATACLGEPFALEGTVVDGEQRGRLIGFPTANLKCDEQLLPAPGVYNARCTVNGQRYRVALSVGSKPTFHGKSSLTVEAYLLDFAGDLYGQFLRIELIAWIRDQAKFPGIEALTQQLHRDVERVRSSDL